MMSSFQAVLRLALIILSASFFMQVSGQSRKEDLQKQKEELNERIALTKKLIRESESLQKNTSNQLSILQEQIRYREALIQTISSEIGTIESEIRSKEAAIESLRNQLETMKSEYARMIVNAYKNRSSYDQLIFIFSASDFNQAYKRFKLTQHYAEARKHQAEAILSMQQEIKTQINSLQTDKEQKEKLAETNKTERSSIAKDKQEKERRLSNLRTEEKKLRDQQKKQEADRRKLNDRIEAIIRAEIEAERKRAEEARRKSEPESTAPKTLELAPAVKLLNADFEKNRGALPWPVSSGVITSRFGKQPHSSLAGIVVDNKGIDFTTDKGGAALAVFEGKVTSIFAIPGAGQNVIVTHGTYKTVYSGLSEVFVEVGDNVSLKERIGTVLFNGEDHILHFEIWKVSAESGAAQNPELWIGRR